ncbi:four helix bundle protein [Cerina litoralis]|uniref:four helix bundle protein n=1 Tax=Cerina litoralis TaxID=2874477 RepID=UPI00295B8563|nr:four helix bundle protein [Cerina litoralis]
MQNIAVAYRKSRYERHFISKLTDADSENSEAQVWLDFAEASGYITKKNKDGLLSERLEIGKLIQSMINNPGKFGV